VRIRKFNEEVLFATDTIVSVGAKDIEQLKHKAKRNKRRRIRLCAHSSHEDYIHEMLIVHEKGCYVQPHKHINKTESFHIIEGMVDIVHFDNDGWINEIISMGDCGSGRKFFYRLPASIYHTLLIKSDVLVFHEITNGPFRPSETVWARWAPEETNEKAVSRYLEKIENYIDGNG
jgi:cupin fold WbuC family metalloprotein